MLSEVLLPPSPLPFSFYVAPPPPYALSYLEPAIQENLSRPQGSANDGGDGWTNWGNYGDHHGLKIELGREGGARGVGGAGGGREVTGLRGAEKEGNSSGVREM